MVSTLIEKINKLYSNGWTKENCKWRCPLSGRLFRSTKDAYKKHKLYEEQYESDTS